MERQNRHAPLNRRASTLPGRSHSICLEYLLQDLQSACASRPDPFAQFLPFGQKDMNN
jgi:hypothetical protein